MLRALQARPHQSYAKSPIKQANTKKEAIKKAKKGVKGESEQEDKMTTAQSTASQKFTKAKLAALRQSKVFASTSRGTLDISTPSSPQTNVYKVNAKTPSIRDHTNLTPFPQLIL